MALEAAPLFGVWHMTLALFFCVGALGVALGLLIGFAIGTLSRNLPKRGIAQNRLDALDQMLRIKDHIDRGNLGLAARDLGITDEQADQWTWEQLQSQVEVRLEAVIKRAIG